MSPLSLSHIKFKKGDEGDIVLAEDLVRMVLFFFWGGGHETTEDQKFSLVFFCAIDISVDTMTDLLASFNGYSTASFHAAPQQGSPVPGSKIVV